MSNLNNRWVSVPKWFINLIVIMTTAQDYAKHITYIVSYIISSNFTAL